MRDAKAGVNWEELVGSHWDFFVFITKEVQTLNVGDGGFIHIEIEIQVQTYKFI